MYRFFLRYAYFTLRLGRGTLFSKGDSKNQFFRITLKMFSLCLYHCIVLTQSLMVPVTDEKLAPILYTVRASAS